MSGPAVTGGAEDGMEKIAFKMKRRKGYHRTKGHRRHVTRLEITSIVG